MPTYRLERCLDRLSGVEVYSGEMTRASGATHRVTFQVVEGDEVDGAALRTFGERLARVSHAALPRLRDVFELDGRAVYVTEEISGRSLDQLLAERPVPARAVFEIGAQLAGALEAVHGGVDRVTGQRLSIRHEAIGAGFVSIDRHGEVRLLGIGGPRGSAAEGHGLSPERVLAQEEGIESDVFALANVLFSALGQVGPFEGRDDAALREIMVDALAVRSVTDGRIVELKERIVSERGGALLRAMTAARKSDRPTMAQVAARCDLISDSVDTPGLIEFARTRVPAANVESTEGQFTGRTVTTDGPSLWTLTETPPPPTPRPAAGRTFSPRSTPLPPPEARAPVLGETVSVASETVETTSVVTEGPMPWSPAETVALFERTPSLAPPRELQPIVVNPLRIPQLDRQEWDDGVTRRYKLAAMQEQLRDEVVDEETPTLVVRDGKPVGPDEFDESLVPTEPVDVPGAAKATPPQERTVYDAPEASEAGTGGPRKPVSVPLPMSRALGEVATPRTPPAFEAPAGLQSAIADVPQPGLAPDFTPGMSAPSPTVVPGTDAGEDSEGEPEAPLASSRTSGLPGSMVAGVLLGGLLGLVAALAILYLFFSAAR